MKYPCQAPPWVVRTVKRWFLGHLLVRDRRYLAGAYHLVVAAEALMDEGKMKSHVVGVEGEKK